MISIITLPESKDTFFYNTSLALQTSYVQSQFNSLLGITVCPTRKGTVWLVYDDVTLGTSYLVEYNLTTQLVVASFQVTASAAAKLIGERSGAHSVIEIASSKLISNNRVTHDIIRFSNVTGIIDHTYGLNIDPFDGTVNPAGTILAYVDGNILKSWDLVNDIGLSDIKDFGFPIIWPTWASDDTIIVFTGSFEGSADDFLRINLAGTIVNTYTGYESLDGIRGFAVSVLNNKLYIYSHTQVNDFHDNFAFTQVRLDTGVNSPLVIVGGITSSFPYTNLATGCAFIYELAITSLSINCSTSNLSIVGSNFPATPNVLLKLNGIAYTDFTLVSNTATLIVVHINSFSSGTWGASVS